MRILKTLAAAMLAFPLAANAAVSIVNTKHNMTATAGAPSLVKAQSETDLCKFCHVPHHAQSTAALWNRYNSAATYDWGSVTKTSGSQQTLPTTFANAGTARCMGCHDGTIGVGDTATATIIMVAGGANDASGKLTGTGNLSTALSGNHPVGIRYAGETNGIQADNPMFQYNTATTGASCKTSTGACVNSTDGNLLPLYGTSGTLTIECSSCHDPHTSARTGPLAGRSFLRVDNASGKICLACHTK